MSGIQLTKALSRPEIRWVWQDVSQSDPLPSRYFLTTELRRWRSAGEDVQAEPYCTLSAGVMKVRAAAARPTSRITLNTSGDRGCQLAGKTPGSEGCCPPVCLLHLTAYQVIPGDTFLSYHIKSWDKDNSCRSYQSKRYILVQSGLVIQGQCCCSRNQEETPTVIEKQRPVICLNRLVCHLLPNYSTSCTHLIKQDVMTTPFLPVLPADMIFETNTCY